MCSIKSFVILQIPNTDIIYISTQQTIHTFDPLYLSAVLSYQAVNTMTFGTHIKKLPRKHMLEKHSYTLHFQDQ